MTTIIEQLMKEHQEVKQLFKDIEKGNQAKKKTARLCMELMVHMETEEKVFYPEAGSINELKEKMAHAKEEHETAKELIKAIQDDNHLDDCGRTYGFSFLFPV